ncbi:chitin deacetylase [Coprinopsis cinerea AmutBmut pab1-1]|nr:chitin deacetylase [Coprinopsis cinerea AmutBmut pab1-1]
MKTLGAAAVLSLAALAEAHVDQDAARRHEALAARQNVPDAEESFSFSLRATNPTAVPLTGIQVTVVSRATQPLPSTAVPGSTPTVVSGAPKLPDISKWDISNYPPENAIPPVDSPEVKQWIEEVKNSGIAIPSLERTNPGGCEAVANAAFKADAANRCWWTCGGCTGPDDITDCVDKDHWGLTFDDGPGHHTAELLQYLDEQKLKATFFVVGSRVLYTPDILQAQYDGGHQIAIHGWSHKEMTTLSDEEIIAELGWSKKIIRDAIGVTPNMWRPPYGDIDDRVRALSLAMGLVPVMWTRTADSVVFNTEDFNINSGTSVQKVLHNWQTILQTESSLNHGFIVLQHDLWQQGVDVATGYILPDGLAHQPKLTIEPVVTCLNMPNANAYIETNDNKTNAPKAKLPSGAAGKLNGLGMVGGAVGVVLGAVGLAAGLIL